MKEKLKKAAWVLLLLLLPMLLPRQIHWDMQYRHAVVRVEVVKQSPDYRRPWKMKAKRSGGGSGCVIAGPRILTCAHVVADQKEVRVLRASDAKWFPAQVEFVAHDSDLALLKVEDPAFFAGIRPLEIGEAARAGDRGLTYSFPGGRTRVFAGKSSINQHEMMTFNDSRLSLLGLSCNKYDQEVGPGSSGGALIVDGRLSAVIYGRNSDKKEEFVAVSVPLINRFLADIADGRYDGVPTLNLDYQDTSNPAMRAALGLGYLDHGVLVNRVEYGSTAYGVLERGDILLSLDGVTIGMDGSVPLNSSEGVDFSFLLSRRQVGEEVELTFRRAGREERGRIKLQAEEFLVPPRRFDTRPAYLVYCGLVFMNLTLDYIRAWRDEWLFPKMNYQYYYGNPEPERSELVVLAGILPHSINQGYQDLEHEIVTRVNGREIRSMADLAPAFAAVTGHWHLVELDSGESIYLDAEAAVDAHAEILEKNKISAEKSACLE